MSASADLKALIFDCDGVRFAHGVRPWLRVCISRRHSTRDLDRLLSRCMCLQRAMTSELHLTCAV